MNERDELGRSGEELAARHLRDNGYSIAARNYRCPIGEIDLIACTRDEVVFVEVKTRRTDAFAPPEASVTPAKQRRIRRVAQHFLNYKRISGINIRFDIIAIVLHDDADTKLDHFENAF